MEFKFYNHRIRAAASQARVECDPAQQKNLQEVLAVVPTDFRAVAGQNEIEEYVGQIISLMRHWCDESMPKKGLKIRRRPDYWWTDEIVELRRERHHLQKRF